MLVFTPIYFPTSFADLCYEMHNSPIFPIVFSAAYHTHGIYHLHNNIDFFFSQQNLQNTERLPKDLSKYWRILFVSCFLFHLQGLIRSIQHLKCLLFLPNIKLQEPTLANALSTGQFLASLSLSNFLDKVYWIIF